MRLNLEIWVNLKRQCEIIPAADRLFTWWSPDGNEGLIQPNLKGTLLLLRQLRACKAPPGGFRLTFQVPMRDQLWRIVRTEVCQACARWQVWYARWRQSRLSNFRVLAFSGDRACVPCRLNTNYFKSEPIFWLNSWPILLYDDSVFLSY